nr:hypothetical protein [Tanacetum cinerariifolium]
MGRQWSAGKLVLILDAVHWNPEAPPRTLPCVRLREKSLDSSKEPKAKRYAEAGGREKKRLRRKKLGFPMLLHAQRDAPTLGCFTLNPIRHGPSQWRDPVGLLPPQKEHQWSAGKLVLILDAVDWNPEAPPRTLPCAACSAVRHHLVVRAANSDVEKSLDSSKEQEAKRYAGAGGREKKWLRRKKLGFPMLLHAQRDALTSGCFTPNPTRDLIRTLHNDLNTLPHLFDTNTVTIIAISSGTYWTTTSLSLMPGPSQWGDPVELLPSPQRN